MTLSMIGLPESQQSVTGAGLSLASLAAYKYQGRYLGR